MLVSPNGQRIYVASTESGVVTVINATTLGLVANIRTGNSPIAMALRPDGSRLYVANVSDSSISVINTATNQVTRTVRDVCPGPVGISATPDNNYAFIACAGTNSLAQYEFDSDTVIGTHDIGRTPVNIAFTSDGKTAYVTSFGSSTLTIYNTDSNSVQNTIELPPCLGLRCVAFGVTLSADSHTVYVADASSDRIHVINAATKEIITSVAVDGGPRGITLTPTAATTPGAAEEGGANQ
ncbi:MAG: beta-propeller fold lactonase family protein [Acidobacteria bacterium]|nr:beta-propeller fold lactonase family protein [Acidobacteriota bacterium]